MEPSARETEDERRRTVRLHEDGGLDTWLYQPEPLPPQPLCVPLPSGWYDDPGYRPNPWAYAGCREPPPQFGCIGTCTRAGELIATSLHGCFAHAYFGSPDSGKSYIQGVYQEAALLPNRYQGALPWPLCVISFGYGRHGSGSHLREQLVARYPNRNEREVWQLIREHGTLPEGLPDLVGLTTHQRVEELRAEHPHCQVLGLRFPCAQLGIDNLKRLMTLNDRSDTLLGEEISDMVDRLPRGFGKEDLLGAVRTYRFRDRHVKRLAGKRLRMAGKLIDDRWDLWGLLRAGRMIVVDLRDPWLPWAKAMRLFQVLLDVLLWGPGQLPCNILLCIDEAHKFLEDPRVRLMVEHLIKERRHLGISIVLSSQDPTAIPRSTLAELDGVGVFRMDGERKLRHLARDFAAFEQLRARDTATLGEGQMYFWSQKWCVPAAPGALDGHLLKLQVRPRMSHHGGATRMAGDPTGQKSSMP